MGTICYYSSMFNNIRIILVNPSHPGNIGAVARAMKNMGLSRLYLTAPEKFPHPEAFFRAAGADDVLHNAVITADLPQALTGCELIYASSARLRDLEWPRSNVRACALDISRQSPSREIALVFGRESSGLTNEELAYCHLQVQIPANAEFSSLNLSAAVQIFAYELRMAALEKESEITNKTESLATSEEILGFYEHLESTLVHLEFLNPAHPKKLMRRLKRLFNRAKMDMTEVNILRGILTAMSNTKQKK